MWRRRGAWFAMPPADVPFGFSFSPVCGITPMAQIHILRTPSSTLNCPDSFKEGAVVKASKEDAAKLVKLGIAVELPDEIKTEAKTTTEAKQTKPQGGEPKKGE